MKEQPLKYDEKVRVAIIAGIRPQFIKMAALLDGINKHNLTSITRIDTVCIDTGQHYDDPLSNVLFSELNLSFDFRIGHEDRAPDAILAHTFLELSTYLRTLNPSPAWIIVFGDGNPGMAAALASARGGYKVAHIEAGEERAKSEHEEINRRIIDALSDVYFCVSRRAVFILTNNGVTRNVIWTGDLAYDFTIKLASEMLPNVPDKEAGGYILASIHRPENLEVSTLTNIVLALKNSARTVFLLCHPRTALRLGELGLSPSDNLHYLEPLSFKETLFAIKGCEFLVTDSGGLIREASHLNKRCVVRRNSGGWPELVDAGYNIRAGRAQAELDRALVKMEILMREKAPPPNLLHRPDGLVTALRTLCDLASH